MPCVPARYGGIRAGAAYPRMPTLRTHLQDAGSDARGPRDPAPSAVLYTANTFTPLKNETASRVRSS